MKEDTLSYRITASTCYLFVVDIHYPTPLKKIVKLIQIFGLSICLVLKKLNNY